MIAFSNMVMVMLSLRAVAPRRKMGSSQAKEQAKRKQSQAQPNVQMAVPYFAKSGKQMEPALMEMPVSLFMIKLSLRSSSSQLWLLSGPLA